MLTLKRVQWDGLVRVNRKRNRKDEKLRNREPKNLGGPAWSAMSLKSLQQGALKVPFKVCKANAGKAWITTNGAIEK